MKILIFAVSLRKDSFNKKLARIIAEQLKSRKGVEPKLIDINDYELPMMNEDLEENGLPANAQKYVDMIKTSDAVIISTPEYNGSITPVCKNIIDWVSRPSPHPWIGKPVLLTAASPGAYGGIRGVLHTRMPLDKLKARVHPDYFNLGKAHEAFDDKGQFTDAGNLKRLQTLLEEFVYSFAPNL